MRCFYTCLILITASLSLQAQNVLPIGKWRSHLPYNYGKWVTQSDEKVYYATSWSVLSIDKEDNSVDFLSTIEGLSNTGVDRIRYNRFSDILIIVYDNSVIDLVKPRGITTMNQIKNFTNLSGEKRILDIHIENDSIIYLATNFGLSKLNISAEEFAFTTFTGIEVEAVTVFEGDILAATAEGIYTIDRDARNPENFGAWQWLGPENGFPGDYSTRTMTSFAEDLYLDVNDTLFRYTNEGLQRLRYEDGHRVEYLTAEGDHLLAGFKCVSDCSSGLLYSYEADGESMRLSSDCLGNPNYAVEDQQGRIWLADEFRFFRSLDGPDDNSCNFRNINSPFSESNREITVFNNEVWMAAGGVDQRFNNRFLRQGFASFIEGQWTIYNADNLRGLQGEDPDDPNDNLLDIITVAVHPETQTVYAGSYYEGLLEFTRESSSFYNEKNSSLGNAVGDEARTRVSGLKFDEDNNLWVSNFLAERPLSVLKNDGAWQNFNLSCGQTQLHQLDVDENGFKWIVVNGGQAGVVLFDEGELDNPADDRCRVFTSSNSELPTNQVNTLVVDQEGDVWVGTTEGVVIFECGGSAFDQNCRGSRRIIQQDGVNAYLLGTEEIQTIAVDGANRKWIGTRNGIFILSPDGEEEVARFTTDNSPLFDNNIVDIAVNQQTGEVFIGTNKGIISYQSDAVQGQRVNREDILVFPNPVRPDYDGPIAIRGLARDADVKITDINGQLVFETQALGGQAIWDGRDYTGRRANSGVYLVFSTSNPRDVGFAGKPDAAVAKIVLLNGGEE